MKWGRWVAGGVVVVLLWAGLAYCAGPPDSHEYRRTAVQAAQSALNAVRTAALTGVAHRDGKLIDPYESTLLDDATGAVAGAQSQLAAQAPPDPDTRRVRDQLAPLLGDAARRVSDLELALSSGDGAAAQEQVTALGNLGKQLDDFVARYR
jgi:hypothetical protein